MAEKQAPKNTQTNAGAVRTGSLDSYFRRNTCKHVESDSIGVSNIPVRTGHSATSTRRNAAGATPASSDFHGSREIGAHGKSTSHRHPPHSMPKKTGTHSESVSQACQPHYEPGNRGTCTELSSLEIVHSWPSDPLRTHVKSDPQEKFRRASPGSSPEDIALELTLYYGSDKNCTYAKAGPSGHPPASHPHDELWHLKNCLRHHNNELRYQIDSMVQQIERLKNIKTLVCSSANKEKEEICRLKALIMSNYKAFVRERRTLHRTIRALESWIADLKHKVRDEECVEECDSSAAQNKQIVEGLLKTKSSDRMCKKYMQEVKALTEQLSQRDAEILQLREQIESLSDKLTERTQQLQAREAENKFTNQQWRKKIKFLHEQVRAEVSKKDQIWETRLELMDERMKQKVNDKFAEEQREMEKEKIQLVQEVKDLEQRNYKLTEDNRKLEEDKNKLLEQNERLKAFHVEMQKNR